MRRRIGDLLAGLLLAAATAAAGAVQPCPPGGNCAAVSISAPAAPVAPGDTVGVTLRVQQGHDDQKPGGIDEIAAMTVSIGIPPLQLADCSPPGTDGLNPSFFLLPAASGSSRVIVQNITCAKRSSCLCPMAGEPRDAYINLLLVGNAGASGVQPLPNGDLLVIALRVPNGGALPDAAPLHIFSALDDPTQVPRPPGAAWLSIADDRAVDQTVDASGTTMNIRVVDGSVALAGSTPTPVVSATAAPTTVGTTTPTAATSASTTPTTSPTSTSTASASTTGTPLATPTLTAQQTSTATPSVRVTPSIGITATITPSGTATTSASATSTATFPPTENQPPTATAPPTANEPPTATATATATDTAPPPTLTATATSPRVCTGDCDHSGDVNIAELVIGVDIVLGTAPASACPAVECLPGNGVDVSCLIMAVNAALNGCPS